MVKSVERAGAYRPALFYDCCDPGRRHERPPLGTAGMLTAQVALHWRVLASSCMVEGQGFSGRMAPEPNDMIWRWCWCCTAVQVVQLIAYVANAKGRRADQCGAEA